LILPLSLLGRREKLGGNRGDVVVVVIVLKPGQSIGAMGEVVEISQPEARQEHEA
jgi:hypothetical protein